MLQKNSSYVRLGDLKEKEFIKQVIGKYATTAAADQFDDCVIVDLEEVCGIKGLPYLVYSLDHPSFIRRSLGSELDHRFYGRWVAAIVCGDVLAMGSRPQGFSLELAAPLDMDSTELEWILQGIREVLEAYGTRFEGGNLDTNNLELVGCAWGVVDRKDIIRRTGAREGDWIIATGILGFGWADWTLRKLDKFKHLSAEAQSAFRNYKLMPLAPHKAIIEAAQTGGITSGMDLSDGLIDFLYTIRERSGLGVRLEEEWFPIMPEMHEAARILGVRPALLALEAGYDSPLAHGWTVAPELWPDIQNIFYKHQTPIHRLGRVTGEQQISIDTANGVKLIEPFWDDQFRKESVIERWFDLIEGL